MGKAIIENTFNIPQQQIIAGTETLAPFVIVGDQAFPLLINLMRPFPEKQTINNNLKEEFNYRLSRARRVSENAFGISTNLFPIFSKPIDIKCEETRNNLIVSACLLHNMIRDESIEFFLTHKSDVPTSRDDNGCIVYDETENCVEFPNEDSATQINSAMAARETFVNYFATELGSVSWRQIV